MTKYRVTRVDESWAEVEADSVEEALEEANDHPDLWDFIPGEPVAEIIED